MSTAALPSGSFDAGLFARLEGLEWKARYVMEGFLSGVHQSPFHGPSVEFRDYRDYHPGDDLRRLDWRLFARSDRLCIKRYEQETNARCYLLCDTSASMSYHGAAAWGSKMECARVLAAALAWVLLKQNDAVGLVALGQPATDGLGARPVRYLAPAQKPLHLGVLLRELTTLEAQGTSVLADLLAEAARLMHRRSMVVLLSDLLEPSEALEEGLKRLRFAGHDVFCVQVLDADEIDFPFADSAVFEDVESGLRRQVHGPSVRASYRERFDAFMGRHREQLRRLEMRHVLVRTDEDPGRALARGLTRVEAGPPSGPGAASRRVEETR